MQKLKIAKIRDVKTPERGTKLSAGLDFFIPKFTSSFLDDFKEKNPNIPQELRKDTYSYYVSINPNYNIFKILISPGERILIPSGIKINLDDKNAMVLFNKSGVSTKKGIIVGACVIDSDYQGEIHLSLFNASNSIVAVNQNEKITQGLLLDVSYSEPIEIDVNDLFKDNSERGSNGFGSTDLKK